ncbi:MAG TPA: hypothetical protein VM509_08165, partial [Planctomycetota bacterium]|nr:hypothetical protein [Planctomycetota bacterium]
LKFLTLLTRPNTKSWLVRGAWVLIAFSTLTSAILAAHWFGYDIAAQYMRSFNVVLGAAAAGYTAFLFRQCEGRDLWQERSLLPHLLVQAVLCGAAAILPFANPSIRLEFCLAAALGVHSLFLVMSQRAKPESLNARQATGYLPIVRMGRIPSPFILGGSLVGVIVPGVLLYVASLGRESESAVVLHAVAVVAILLGLFSYKYAYIRAGQLPPLS